MKKRYEKPQAEVIVLNTAITLLTGSYGGTLSSREYDNFDWDEE